MTTDDNDERQRAEAALRESEQRLRAIVQTAVDGLLTIDEHGTIESFNPAAVRIFGYEADEAIGRHLSMLVPAVGSEGEWHDGRPADQARAPGPTGTGLGRELVGRRKDGSEFPMLLFLGEVRLGGRRIFTGTVRDITERRRAEAELRDTAERMRAIWQTAVDGIITIDSRGIMESINPAACRIFGYTPEELIGRNVSLLMPSPDREQHDAYLENYRRTGHRKIIGIGREVHGQRKDGTVFPMELAVAEVRLGDRLIFTGMVRDITERRELERAAAAASEQERARVARELHDGLGQQLGGLLFMLKGLHRDLESAGSPHAKTAGELCHELEVALAQARNLAHEFHTIGSDPDALAQALDSLAHRVNAPGRITSVFSRGPDTEVRDEVVANHLYRIAQEAVHNALKHSGATRLEIDLARRGGELVLTVSDNGAGLSAPPDTSGGLGLRTMRQRARLVGGKLAVHSLSAGGVAVVCTVPRPQVGS